MGTRDPRSEPLSDAPDAEAAAEPNPKPDAKPAAKRAPQQEVIILDAPDAAPKPRVITSMDPRLEAIEPLLKRSDWTAIIKELGPVENAGSLPPHLGLLFALAVNESNAPSEVVDPAELAIRCAAGLFGVPAESEIALVVGKRLLRKNPLSFGKRPAPRARVSVLIVLVTLVVGAGVGWLVTGGGSLRSLFP